MKAKELQNNEDVRRQYNEWINHPMTKIVIDILRTEGRVILPPSPQVRAENCIVEAGRNDGWHNCVDRMTTLDQSTPAQEEPKASFGAEAIAKVLGIKIKPEEKGTNNE